MFVSTNIRILPSLSITRFIYKRLNIIFAGYAHCFSSPDKGSLRFSDGRSGGVTDNNLPHSVFGGTGVYRRILVQAAA